MKGESIYNLQLYYKDEYVELFQGDCLEVMDKLIEKGIKFDAIITDPPYGTTACKWDAIIPFDKMWSRLKQLIIPTGAIVLFGSQPYTSALIMSNPNMFKYCWVWVKTKASGHLDAKRKPMRKHEDIIIFGNKGWPNYYPQGLIDGEFKTGRNVDMTDKVYSQYKNHGTSTKGNYPKSVIEFANPSGKGHLHPTQKPIPLLEYLINTYTNENDLILDFTCGSGTTLLAARNLKRKCIGIELEEKYCKIAKNRLIA